MTKRRNPIPNPRTPKPHERTAGKLTRSPWAKAERLGETCRMGGTQENYRTHLLLPWRRPKRPPKLPTRHSHLRRLLRSEIPHRHHIASCRIPWLDQYAVSNPSSPIASRLPINRQCPEVIQEKVPFDSDTDRSETEEELIELGENQLPDAGKHGWETIDGLRLHPGKTTRDTVASTAEESDSSEDDTNLNLVRSTVSNKRKGASQLVESEAGTSSDGSDVPSSVSVQRTPKKSRDATSSRSTVTAQVLSQSKRKPPPLSPITSLHPPLSPAQHLAFKESLIPVLVWGLRSKTRTTFSLPRRDSNFKLTVPGTGRLRGPRTTHVLTAIGRSARWIHSSPI